MNILLWILQIPLALWNLIGSLYMVTHQEELITASALAVYPKFTWTILCALQFFFGLGLLYPTSKYGKFPSNYNAAIGLTFTSLFGLLVYSAYKGFPGILWGIIPALLTSFIAYQRRPH